MFYDMQNSLNIIVTPEGYVWFSEKRQILTGLFLAAHFNADKAAMWLIQKY